MNAAILTAAWSTVAATTASIVAGVVIGVAGAVARASQTEILGNEWSWTDFAVAGAIGALSGAYSGLAG